MSGEEADQLQQRALAGAHEIIDSSTSPSRGAVDDAGLAILLLILRNFGVGMRQTRLPLKVLWLSSWRDSVSSTVSAM